MESDLVVKMVIGFAFQLALTVGAVIFAVRIGLAKLQVKVENLSEDIGRIETKVDKINGRVRDHDTTIAVHEERLDRLTPAV